MAKIVVQLILHFHVLRLLHFIFFKLNKTFNLKHDKNQEMLN